MLCLLSSLAYDGSNLPARYLYYSTLLTIERLDKYNPKTGIHVNFRRKYNVYANVWEERWKNAMRRGSRVQRTAQKQTRLYMVNAS